MILIIHKIFVSILFTMYIKKDRYGITLEYILLLSNVGNTGLIMEAVLIIIIDNYRSNYPGIYLYINKTYMF